ncbi:MAG: hypothetical protein FKY71_08375 [Spiribacter salinus]|uniref:Uncharacterized protein n=1 Tax=Spiribacter salinus TaxID=1335746 RepID=A0A540VRV1_9GAMM|nr:MAG: hypothetical protein FKY71_08375 [Spiribacter salinus]
MGGAFVTLALRFLTEAGAVYSLCAEYDGFVEFVTAQAYITPRPRPEGFQGETVQPADAWFFCLAVPAPHLRTPDLLLV